MKPDVEMTPLDGPLQAVWSLENAARSRSIRAGLRKPSQAQQEEQMNDFDQLIQAALEEVPEGQR